MTLFHAEEAHITVTDGSIKNGATGQPLRVKAGPAASFKLSVPTPAEPEANQAFNVTITALDAGGNVATSYGGAGGQNKTIAYSGPEASPSGKAPEYPGVGDDRQLPRRRRQCERHQALPLRREHAHGEGRDDRRVGRVQREGGRRGVVRPLRAHARRTRSRAGVQRHDHRARRVRQRRAPSYGGAAGQSKMIAYSGPKPRPRARRPNTRRRRRRSASAKASARRPPSSSTAPARPRSPRRKGRSKARLAFTRQGGRLQELRRHADPRRNRKPGRRSK